VVYWHRLIGCQILGIREIHIWRSRKSEVSYLVRVVHISKVLKMSFDVLQYSMTVKTNCMDSIKNNICTGV